MSRHSENLAGDGRDPGLFEQPGAEFEAVHTEPRDAREGVEGARWRDRLEALDIVQPLDDHIAAAFILRDHRPHIVVGVGEGLDNPSLRE